MSLVTSVEGVLNKLPNVTKLCLGVAAGSALVNFVLGWGTVTVLALVAAAVSYGVSALKAKPTV